MRMWFNYQLQYQETHRRLESDVAYN
jgi:hypothetical protein